MIKTYSIPYSGRLDSIDKIPDYDLQMSTTCFLLVFAEEYSSFLRLANMSPRMDHLDPDWRVEDYFVSDDELEKCMQFVKIYQGAPFALIVINGHHADFDSPVDHHLIKLNSSNIENELMEIRLMA